MVALVYPAFSSVWLLLSPVLLAVSTVQHLVNFCQCLENVVLSGCYNLHDPNHLGSYGYFYVYWKFGDFAILRNNGLLLIESVIWNVCFTLLRTLGTELI